MQFPSPPPPTDFLCLGKCWSSEGGDGVATRCHPAKQGAKKLQKASPPFGASSMNWGFFPCRQFCYNPTFLGGVRFSVCLTSREVRSQFSLLKILIITFYETHALILPTYVLHWWVGNKSAGWHFDGTSPSSLPRNTQYKCSAAV